MRADGGGELDVGPFVANHEGARRIESEIAHRRMNHAGRRLAARASGFRRVRASIPTCDRDAFAGEKVNHAPLDRIGLFNRKIPASDA